MGLLSRTLRAVLAAAIVAAPLGTILAQDAPAPAPAAEAEAPARGDAEAAEPAPRSVAPVTGEKVEVTMQGGVVITGVVKGARAEVLRGVRFETVADQHVPGAGVRVYYAMGLNGYLFVPYESMIRIRFEGQLTEAEGERLAADIEEAKEKAEEDRVRSIAEIEAKKAAAAAAAAESGEGAGDAIAGGATAVKPAAADAAATSEAERERQRAVRIKELISRFPPEEWKPARLDEIKKRAIILDIFPSEEERAFMDNYDLWLQGYEIWQKTQPAASK